MKRSESAQVVTAMKLLITTFQTTGTTDFTNIFRGVFNGNYVSIKNFLNYMNTVSNPLYYTHTVYENGYGVVIGV
jgi:hypothetical protein